MRRAKTQVLTLRRLMCRSEISILGGSESTCRCAEPHVQLLPGHGGGRLGGGLVGHLWTAPLRSVL